MDGAQVGVFKETNEVSLASFLKSHHGGTLESQVGFEILGDFTNKTLERQLANQKFGGLLVTTNLTEGDSSRPVTMGFLHTASCWSALSCCFGGKLLARGFSAS